MIVFVPSVLSQALAFTSAPASLPTVLPPSTYGSSGWWCHLHAGWRSPPPTYGSSGWWCHLHAGWRSPPPTYGSSGWCRDVCGRDCPGCCPACKMCIMVCFAPCDHLTVSSPVGFTTSPLLLDDVRFHHRIAHDLIAKAHSDAESAMTIWVLHTHVQKVGKGTRLLYPMR